MRILFFSYLSYDNNYKGGGWVDSLINTLNQHHDIGVVYISKNPSCFKHNEKQITYFPYSFPRSLFLQAFKFITHNPDKVVDYEYVERIIEDFSPDIIQLFGAETPFAKVLNKVNQCPVVIHIQGAAKSYIEKWLPI